MTAKTASYWLATGLVSLMMFGSGIAYLTGGMDDAFAHMGFPTHFALLLGAWKLGVAPALLTPGLPRLKELAYAGLFFTCTGAVWSHLAIGDGLGGIVAPLVTLGLTAASWALFREVRGVDAELGRVAPRAAMHA